MILAVTGSRHWEDRERVIAELNAIHYESTVMLIVHGGAEHVDEWAEEWARNRGIRTLTIRPDYSRYHPKLAPLMRNSLIVFKADKVIAFRAAGKSNGTDNTIAKAEAAHKLLKVVRESSLAGPECWCGEFHKTHPTRAGAVGWAGHACECDGCRTKAVR